MEKIILAFPVVLGVLLVVLGLLLRFKRQHTGIRITGIITGISKSQTKVSTVSVEKIAPVVEYTIEGQKITAVSSKSYTSGTANFVKGRPIDITVSRRNHRKFVPTDSGGAAEAILIACGTFMAAGCIIMISRYF